VLGFASRPRVRRAASALRRRFATGSAPSARAGSAGPASPATASVGGKGASSSTPSAGRAARATASADTNAPSGALGDLHSTPSAERAARAMDRTLMPTPTHPHHRTRPTVRRGTTPRVPPRLSVSWGKDAKSFARSAIRGFSEVRGELEGGEAPLDLEGSA